MKIMKNKIRTFDQKFIIKFRTTELFSHKTEFLRLGLDTEERTQQLFISFKVDLMHQPLI